MATEGQCPPKETFNNINKPKCFYCQNCKRKLYNDIKEDKRKKGYKHGKEFFTYKELEGDDE